MIDYQDFVGGIRERTGLSDARQVREVAWAVLASVAPRVGPGPRRELRRALPANMRAAIQAIGTHIAFQLGNDDALAVAAMLDGGKPLAELLKNLPKRNFVAKSGHYPWRQVEVPEVKVPSTDFKDLLERSRKRFARLRSEVEEEIQARRPKQKQTAEEVLDGWE